MDLRILSREGTDSASGIKLWQRLSAPCRGLGRRHFERRSLTVWLAQSAAQLGDILRIERDSALDDSVDARHAKPATTARYIHAVNAKQIEAQGQYLEAIKLGKKGKEAA